MEEPQMPQSLPVEGNIPPQSTEPVSPVEKTAWWKRNISTGQTIAALFLVLAIMGGATGAIYLVTKVPEPEPAPAPKLKQAAPKAQLTLSLTSPTTDTVAEGKMLKVMGATLPQTPVVIFTETSEETYESDTTGKFEGEIELAEGVNVLTVTAMGENGEEKTLTYDVVYDSQVLGVKTEGTKTEDNKKVIKGEMEEISKNVKIDKLTKYADEKNKPMKSTQVKPKDKAIIVAEDETATSGAKLKKALKVFVRTATESASVAPKRKAVQGLVSSIEGQIITLVHQTQRDRQTKVTAGDTTVIKIKGVTEATFAQIQVGNRIIAVGDNDDSGGIIAKKIYVIPGKATGLFVKQPAPTQISTPSATPVAILTPTATPTATLAPSPTEEPVVTETPTP